MNRSKFIFLFVAIAIILLRWLFPEADPPWFKGLEDLHDETWWAENARRKIITGSWMWDEYAGALASGPLTALWHYLSFRFLGISFFSLRLYSLLPATITGILLIRSRVFNSAGYPVLLLLLSSGGLFALSRIAYAESMLLCCFLSSLVLTRKKTVFAAIAGAILLVAGMLFKGSFIYLAAPLLLWILIDSEIPVKLKYYWLGGFSILCLLAILFYFLPNRELFHQYISYFSANNYSIRELLHPGGWIARLVWLPSKETLAAPFAGWVFLLFIINQIKHGFVVKRGSFSMLFWFCLIAVLASDFSDRRLVFLFVLPALAISDKQDGGRPGLIRIVVGSFFLALPVLQYFTPIGLSSSNLLQIYVLPAALLLITIVAAKIAENSILKYKGLYSPVLIVSSFITGHSIIYHTSVNWATTLGIGFASVYILQLLLLAVLFYRCLRQDEYAQNLFVYSLVLTQLVVCSIVVSNSEFSIRNKAKQIADHYPNEIRFKGNPQALELLFLSGSLNNFTESVSDTGCPKPAMFLFEKNSVDRVKISTCTGSGARVETDSLVPGQGVFRMSYYLIR